MEQCLILSGNSLAGGVMRKLRSVSIHLSQWLKQETGHHVTLENEKNICLAVEILSQEANIDPEMYIHQVMSYTRNKQPLIDAITTHESYFNRSIDQVLMMIRQIIQPALKKEPNQRFRILSIPCACGEEPSSIVMQLLDAGISPHQFDVVGVDIAENCIQAAKAGYYRELALRRTNDDIRNRFFQKKPEGLFKLSDRVKSKITYLKHNLLLDMGPNTLGKFDIIFCENLLIYFDDPTIAKAMGVIKGMMKDTSWLFVDYSEWSIAKEFFHPHCLQGVTGYRRIPSQEELDYQNQHSTVNKEESQHPFRNESCIESLPSSLSKKIDHNVPETKQSVLQTASNKPEPTQQSLTSQPQREQLQEGFSESHLLRDLLTQATQAYQNKDFSMAMSILDSALIIDPTCAQVLALVSRIYADSNQAIEAMDHAEQALDSPSKVLGPLLPRERIQVIEILILTLQSKKLMHISEPYMKELKTLDPTHKLLALFNSSVTRT
jgi:chemotaxis protein methyltransferase WspC